MGTRSWARSGHGSRGRGDAGDVKDRDVAARRVDAGEVQWGRVDSGDGDQPGAVRRPPPLARPYAVVGAREWLEPASVGPDTSDPAEGGRERVWEIRVRERDAVAGWRP